MLVPGDAIDRAQAVDGFVADDRERLDYAGLAERVADITETLRGQDWAAPGHVVALGLGNDLAALAALLALFDLSVSVAVMPANAPGDAPGFCSARLDPQTLTASAVNGGGGAGAAEPPRLYLGTSGSTGTAKWVIIGMDALGAVARAMVGRLRMSERDRVLIPIPICHSYGLATAMVTCLAAGASVRLTARGDPVSIIQAERTTDPTFAFLIPSQCRTLMPLRRKPRHYRGVVVATGRLTPEFAAGFEAMHGPVCVLYGSTELSAVAVAAPTAPADHRHRVVGPPLDGIGLVIEGGDEGDGSGPLLVRHDGRFLGYADGSGNVGVPAATLHRTGDLGRIDETGNLIVLGRADNRIKRDGLWVLLDDVEACLADAPGVAEVAVVTAGETRRGPGVIAFYRVEPGAGVSPVALLRHCRAVLPGYAVPDRIVPVDALPRLASGKVDRQGLIRDATERTGD